MIKKPLCLALITVCGLQLSAQPGSGKFTRSYKHKNINKTVSLFLKRPWKTFREHKVPKNFRIITLSTLSEYIVNLKIKKSITLHEAHISLNRCLTIALHKNINPYRNIGSAPLGGHGLYLSHLNVILGSYSFIKHDNPYQKLNTRISEHLAQRSMTDPYFTISSYAGNPRRWPADQSVTLYSLYLYDKNNNTRLSVKPIQAWTQYMSTKGLSAEWKLPKSEVTMRTSYSKYPRGCALSYTVRYTALFAKKYARNVWDQYKRLYLIHNSLTMITGFREWPPGVKRKADMDSGPIVLDIGAAASGYAVPASKIIEDNYLYSLLLFTKQLVMAGKSKKLQELDKSILSKAILLYSQTYTPWY